MFCKLDTLIRTIKTSIHKLVSTIRNSQYFTTILRPHFKYHLCIYDKFIGVILLKLQVQLGHLKTPNTNFKPLNIVTNLSIFDVCLGSSYFSEGNEHGFE